MLSANEQLRADATIQPSFLTGGSPCQGVTVDDEDEVDKPDEVDPDEGPEFRENDPAFVEACNVLDHFFEVNKRDVYYHRQLTVLFEKKWFHWITGRALNHLVELGTIATSLETIPDLS